MNRQTEPYNDESAQAQACPHVGKGGGANGFGYKVFTGRGRDVVYQCDECHEAGTASLAPISAAEALALEATETYWSHKGLPAIRRSPRPFSFTQSTVVFEGLKDSTVKAFAALPQSPGEGIAITDQGQLWRLNVATGTAQPITTLSDEQVPLDGQIDLVVSADGQFYAVTGIRAARRDDATGAAMQPAENKGVAGCLQTGQVLMPLACGDYHTELTSFPVVFFSHGGRTLMVHATDWNRLDISDPRTGECLTPRPDDVALPETAHQAVFSEWSGSLKVSPQQTHIATIGWAWHPVGMGVSWSLHDWLTQNLWEPDNGASKRNPWQYPYYWHTSFAWLDDKRLCIWGDDRFTNPEHDIPDNTVAIFDVTTGDRSSWFAGPTSWPFEFDTYLFTGHTQGEGLAVWDVDRGCLLHEHAWNPGPGLLAYQPADHTFLHFGDAGHVSLLHWQAGVTTPEGAC